jgi:hypothetical protein
MDFDGKAASPESQKLVIYFKAVLECYPYYRIIG